MSKQQNPVSDREESKPYTPPPTVIQGRVMALFIPYFQCPECSVGYSRTLTDDKLRVRLFHGIQDGCSMSNTEFYRTVAEFCRPI